MFLLGFALEQLPGHIGGGFRVLDNVTHSASDGHIHFQPLGPRRRLPGRVHTFRNMTEPAQYRVERLPASKRETNLPVA